MFAATGWNPFDLPRSGRNADFPVNRCRHAGIEPQADNYFARIEPGPAFFAALHIVPGHQLLTNDQMLQARGVFSYADCTSLPPRHGN